MTFFGLNATTGQLDEAELDDEVRDVVEAVGFLQEWDRAEIVAAGLVLFAAGWRDSEAVQELVRLREQRREQMAETS